MKIKGLITKIIFIILATIPIMAWEGGEYVLTIFSIFVLVWLISPRLKPLIKKIPIPLFVKTVLLGIIFATITEYFVFLEKGIGIKGESGLFSQNLSFNLILAMGIYISLILVWYFLLKKYKFSLRGIFFSAGIWGVVVEEDFTVLLSLNPLAYLYIFLAYGSFVAVTFLLIEDNFANTLRKENKARYIVAFFAQFIAYITGFLWMALLKTLVG